MDYLGNVQEFVMIEKSIALTPSSEARSWSLAGLPGPGTEPGVKEDMITLPKLLCLVIVHLVSVKDAAATSNADFQHDMWPAVPTPGLFVTPDKTNTLSGPR